MHRPASTFRIVFAHRPVDVVVLFGGLFEIFRAFYRLTAAVKEDGGDHVHQRRKNTVVRSRGDRATDEARGRVMSRKPASDERASRPPHDIRLVAQICDLRGRGETADAIARRLGLPSRCSVIGIWFRERRREQLRLSRADAPLFSQAAE